MIDTTLVDREALWEALAMVSDPEIPSLSIVDLGLVRGIEHDRAGWLVTITPTYSGCPAMDVIEHDIGVCLTEHGFLPYRIETQISPPWTTDWMTERGKAALRDIGIAPPRGATEAGRIDFSALSKSRESVTCPQCGSRHTQLLSAFGSTACKALYRCNDCLEPFDHFKEH